MRANISSFRESSRGKRDDLVSVDVTSHRRLLIRNLVEGTSAEAVSRAIEDTGVNKDCFVVNEPMKDATNR